MEYKIGDTLVLKSGHKIVFESYVNNGLEQLNHTNSILALGENGKWFFGKQVPLSINAIKNRSVIILTEKYGRHKKG